MKRPLKRLMNLRGEWRAMKAPIIYWFRQDLRLQDLSGLRAAAATGRPVLPCFILDDESPGEWCVGGASRWWLHHSLEKLAQDISARGGKLLFFKGTASKIISQLVHTTGANAVFCSRQYEPWNVELEQSLHTQLDQQGVSLKRFPGSLLWEPETVSNQQGLPYKVFTPFWRFCRSQPQSIAPAGPCNVEDWFLDEAVEGVTQGSLEDLGLLPSNPDWAAGWSKLWQPGEQGASQKLTAFLQETVVDYEQGRDFPAMESTSRLSPHLHFGEIAAQRVYCETLNLITGNSNVEVPATKFLSELGWREFCNHLLFHFPHIPHTSFNAKFEQFPWLGSAVHLSAWQLGRTGYPLVDAGMRELWQTGFMHNRVRMVVASFLCKHLLIDWRAGQRWFWDTLLDADLANNACSWQWVSGSGADASPYFRIFNPIIQGKKFDKAGEYIRQWVPELAQLPDRYLHEPWLAPEAILAEHGVVMDDTYPLPIVDHRSARESALAAFAEV